jgi:predicted ATP-dependent endonuclease of OLD family
MLLYKIHIENYRSIENLTLSLNKGNVLVGKNNTGKSNVLKAIDLVLGEKFLKLTKNDFFNQDDSKTIKIDLFFNGFSQNELDAIKKEIIYGVKVEDVFYSPEQIQEELETKKEVKIEIEISNGRINKNIFFGEIYYKYFSNELKNAIVNTVFVPSIRDHNQILKITEYSFLNKLLNKIYEKAEQDKKDELKEILEKATDKCKEIFNEYEIKLDNISKSIIEHKGLRMSMLPSNYQEIYKKLTLLLNDGIETELDFKGSGIQSVIIISLFKLYADLKIGSAILLIEEPESFLHPQANRHMAKILNDICKEDNIQLIITTHSPNYLQDIDLKNIILLKKEGNKTVKNQIDYLQDEVKLRKELNTSNLELFFADKVILVEGETDKILLPAFAKTIKEDYDFDKKNISIIDVGSKSNLDAFIELLNSFNISWLALLDKDFVSMTESKGLLKRMNSKFGYEINFDSITEPELISKLKENNIYVFTCGEIENYYIEEWLNKILEDFINNLDLSAEIKSDIKTKINAITTSSQIGEIKKDLNSRHSLDDYDSAIVNKLINIKFELLTLNLDDEKIGKKLERVFDTLNLTKPKIAIRIKEHINVEQMPVNKKENLIQIINYIFT